MWLTIVEGHVAQECWDQLREIFAREQRPAALRQFDVRGHGGA